jgi:hypothetical protein
MRRPTLKKVRDWTPPVRLVTPLPAPARAPKSDIRELRPTTYEEEEDTLVRLPSTPPPPLVTRPREPSRTDEALEALVGAYVEKTSRPPPPLDDEDVTEPEPPPVPMISERRAIAKPKAPRAEVAATSSRAHVWLAVLTIALVVDAAVKAAEDWLGSLDTKQRVVFIATSAIVASIVTLLVAD